MNNSALDVSRGAKSLLRCGPLVAVLGLLAAGCAVDSDATLESGETSQDIAATGFNLAMQANAAGNHHLWLVSHTTAVDTGQTMQTGTSPAIVSYAANGSVVYAFHGSNGHLWISDLTGLHDTGFTMKTGTSPSLAKYIGAQGNEIVGEYEVAWQGDDTFMWTTGQLGLHNSLLGMAPGTSPSITAIAGTGQFRVAIQANTNVLWTTGVGSAAGGDLNTGLAMKPGTNPSIARTSTGHAVAFADPSNFLEVFQSSTGTAINSALGMWPGSSPSIVPAATNGFNVAFNAFGTGHLWTTNGGDTGIAMKAATSPSFAVNSAGAIELAFQDSSSFLHTLDANGSTNQALGMDPASSPSAN